jgi:hypothetical protein
LQLVTVKDPAEFQSITGYQAPELKIVNFNGWQTLVNREMGVGPYFSSMLRYRVGHKLACNVIVSGEPGIGKSYQAMNLARVNEGMKKDTKGYATQKDRFEIKQVVFTFSEYMDLIMNLRAEKNIMFDEPSYAMGKRDWFKEVNKVLVQTIESQRFLVHPLWIPIINQCLLDKTIRAYLIQFRVNVIGRGHAIAYRIHASQSNEKIYQYQICDLYYRVFDKKLCPKDSCLGCKSLNDPVNPCQVFRAQYERKKYSIQHTRYEQAKEGALQKETQEMTEDQIVELLVPMIPNITNHRGRIDVAQLRLKLKEQHHMSISPYKAYNLKGILEAKYADKIGI